VLPFVDLSPQKDQEYFSDGLAEELINDLAQTQGLRVVARTSSFQFKGKSDDLRVIGERLNAANILEGSVRKQGNRVRITGQLIKTSDGYHLWSETYDAEMNDIFAVQEQIARSVAGSLKLTLLGGPPPGPPNRSENAEAYDAYLQGRYFAELQGKENLQRAVGYYERATKLDPHYVPAWTGLAEVYKWQAGRGYLLEKGETREEGFRKARQAVSRAITLDPDSAEANAMMASIQMLYDWDWQGADVSLKRAMALGPDKPKVLQYAAALAGIMGDQEQAIVLDRHLIALDPLDPTAQMYFASHCWYAGRLDEAVAAYRKALELTPEYQGAHHGLALIYLQQGKSREALTEAQREPLPIYRLQGLTLLYRATGRDKESDAALEELIGKFQGESDFQIAEVYGFQGDRERTFQWLERAYVRRDPGLPFVKGDPAFEKNKDDPRYAALLKKMRLPL
jgi:TolB-like protein/cytochrome c-type biogenesis protein CcmH/NrfG